MSDPVADTARVKAVCLFTNGDSMLAIDGFDLSEGRHFWVPVGGGVEFGETSRDAIAREVREELSAEITDLTLLGVLENIFTLDGARGHEIVFVYDATLVDARLYQQDQLHGIENGIAFTAEWIDPHDPTNGWPLYPEGLAELIGERNRQVGPASNRSRS